MACGLCQKLFPQKKGVAAQMGVSRVIVQMSENG